MPMLVDVLMDGEFSGWDYDDTTGRPTGGELWEYKGRIWLLDNGLVLRVGN